MIGVNVKLLSPNARIPTYSHRSDAGADLYASQAQVLNPGGRALVHTGIALEIPDGFEAQVRPRSGLAAKHGITVLNAPGTIDSGYVGEVCVILHNSGREHFKVNCGDRIAQLVFAPVTQAAFSEVSGIDDTERGNGGFGSTGV